MNQNKFLEYLNNSNIGMASVIHQRTIVGQYSMIGANNMITKNVFPYYINISNKIHRLNKVKLPEHILNYDQTLREIQHNFENKSYELDKYDLPIDIKNVLETFISKIKH
jgi:acyl-[acyl carrier protein]--UDP-N-acetylglucosamine O-acyltransferase